MIFNNINVSMINKDIIRVQKYRFQNKNTLFIPTKSNSLTDILNATS